jgi:hypothetical protein
MELGLPSHCSVVLWVGLHHLHQILNLENAKVEIIFIELVNFLAVLRQIIDVALPLKI